MANELTLGGRQAVTLMAEHDLSNIIKPLQQEIHLFDTYIAGTTYLKDKSVLAQIKKGDHLALQREDNKFDDHAILILNSEKKKLGYVPEKDNIIFSRLMDAGKLLSAKIKTINQKGTFTQIQIGIYLVDF